MAAPRYELITNLEGLKGLVRRWQDQAAEAEAAGAVERQEALRTCIGQLLMDVYGMNWDDAEMVATGKAHLNVQAESTQTHGEPS